MENEGGDHTNLASTGFWTVTSLISFPPLTFLHPPVTTMIIFHNVLNNCFQVRQSTTFDSQRPIKPFSSISKSTLKQNIESSEPKQFLCSFHVFNTSLHDTKVSNPFLTAAPKFPVVVIFTPVPPGSLGNNFEEEKRVQYLSHHRNPFSTIYARINKSNTI